MDPQQPRRRQGPPPAGGGDQAHRDHRGPEDQRYPNQQRPDPQQQPGRRRPDQQNRPDDRRRPEDRRPEGRPDDRTQHRRGAAAAGAAGAAAGGYAAYASEEPDPGLITHQGYGRRDYSDPYGHTGYQADPLTGAYDEDGFSDEDAMTSAASHADGGLDPDAKKPTGRKAKNAALTPVQRKKRRWRRVRRTLYACVGLFVVVPAIAFVITYFLVDVPTPEEVAAEQGKIVNYYYAGGEKMAEEAPPEGRRVILQPEDVPDTIKHAAYAAEDATFETNSGFDVTGILRAVWNQVSGGSGGGSTISQQYVKVATENDEYSYTRKWTELVKSFKMNNEQSKAEIITAYLNTIYFGRGAYGIETAAQSYYGKSAKDLNASESALLAGMIQQPGRVEDDQVRERRWSYVMDQMVANNWLSKQERNAAQPPTLIPDGKARPEALTGADAFVKNRVMAELAAKGYSQEKIQTGGYKIYTTIDKRAQKAAKESVNEAMKGEPKELRKALVAVDPKGGGVRAYYGGPNEAGVDEVDWANVQRNPGSAFKPFDFTALLQQGEKGLYSTYDGSSPREFGAATVGNANGVQCNPCTVREAMERSINTVFYDMVTNDVGPRAVADAAKAAGIPEKHGNKPTMGSLDGNISIGGGQTQVTPTDMAGAYATFAADGIQRDTHFVAKLETSDGEVLFDETTPAAKKGEQAFDSDPDKNQQISRNVTESMLDVLPGSDLSCPGDHSCAGKTGTHQHDEGDVESDQNAQAWMVGYSPQISASAWVGTGRGEPIVDASGSPVYGSGLPGTIWEGFMSRYLEPLDPEEFSDLSSDDIFGPAQEPVTDDSSPSEEEPSEAPSSNESPSSRPSSEPSRPSRPSQPPSNGRPSAPSSPAEPTESDDGGGIFDPGEPGGADGANGNGNGSPGG